MKIRSANKVMWLWFATGAMPRGSTVLRAMSRWPPNKKYPVAMMSSRQGKRYISSALHCAFLRLGLSMSEIQFNSEAYRLNKQIEDMR